MKIGIKKYQVLAVNLNACDRIILKEVSGGFQLVLDKSVDSYRDNHMLIESYEQKADAIQAFEYHYERSDSGRSVSGYSVRFTMILVPG